MCLALSDDIAKHCYLTVGHTELHLGDELPERGECFSAGEAILCKFYTCLYM